MTKSSIRIVIFAALILLVVGFLYRHSPRKVEFLGHYDKIGAHRVNTIDKLTASLSYFDAIELDLVYNPLNGNLDVTHPPTPPTGLHFETYAAALNGATPFLWLDIKNLDAHNAQVILEKLNTIFETYSYDTSQVLIETRYPEALPVFQDHGYKTSYYLPQQLHALKEDKLQRTVLSISKILEQQTNLGISTSYEDYKIIKKHFTKRPKYLWSISHRKFGDYSLVQEFLEDSTVKLVLVRYHPL